MKSILLVIVLFLFIALAACGARPVAAPIAGVIAPTTAASATAQSPATAEPTATPEPSATPAPSATAEPTVTAEPSPTATSEPAPTAPVESTAAASSSALPARLTISAIGLDRPLYAVGLDAQRVPVVLDHDVAWYQYSARPNQGENIVLWGHVLRFRKSPEIPAPFERLKELEIGAEITLYDEAGNPHRYAVSEQILATPDEVEYILPSGREMLTLVSCIGDKVIVNNSTEMTHRLITIAEPIP
ncbi:MAG: sortase [Oscillochloris sp.]|nr:sortase [Oscillochloris sp.]